MPIFVLECIKDNGECDLRKIEVITSYQKACEKRCPSCGGHMKIVPSKAGFNFAVKGFSSTCTKTAEESNSTPEFGYDGLDKTWDN